LDDLLHLVEEFGELDELDGAVRAEEPEPRIVATAREIRVVLEEHLVVEDAVVCPVPIDRPAEALLFVRPEETPVVGVLAPPDPGVHLRPSICDLAILYHLDDQFDRHPWQLAGLNDAVDGSVTADLCAKKLAALIGLVGYDQLHQFREWAV